MSCEYWGWKDDVWDAVSAADMLRFAVISGYARAEESRLPAARFLLSYSPQNTNLLLRLFTSLAPC